MMERFEEYILDGKNFLYIDLAALKTAREYKEIAEAIKTIVGKYPEKSLRTITNLGDAGFDSDFKAYLVDVIAHNKPYVAHGAMIGFDGIKKMIINSICKMAGRKNMHFAFSREKAAEWLLKQD